MEFLHLNDHESKEKLGVEFGDEIVYVHLSYNGEVEYITIKP